jgi:hypothetical protein
VPAGRSTRSAATQPQGQAHHRNPGPSSPNEPGGIFTANLKGVELANLPTVTLGEVADAAQQGIERIRHTHHLALSFLRHGGLSLW